MFEHLPMCFQHQVLPKIKNKKSSDKIFERETNFTSSFLVTTESDAGSRFDADKTSFN